MPNNLRRSVSVRLAQNAQFKHHMQRAKIELPGEDYLSLLTQIHATLEPAAYVEIGVATGKTLRLAGPGTTAIGIDPKPEIAFQLGADTRVFTETSDAFFAQRDLRAELRGKAVDMAFIDGRHVFEFALRDFINLERYASPCGVILIHDCYPLNAETSTRTRRTVYWTGDVWRALLALRTYRPDLSVRTLTSPPSGLALITRLDPESRLLEDGYDRIVAEFMECDYASIASRKAAALNVTPAVWAEIEPLVTRT